MFTPQSKKSFRRLFMQDKMCSATRLLENYAVLPIRLRAQVEGWEVQAADMSLGAKLGNEQV